MGEIPSLMFSPVVRRRGGADGCSTSSVTVSASIRLPPPPSFRPPPPPVSPPIPAAKVKDIVKINGNILESKKETSSEEESESEEEVSEWEYETESEED